MDWLRRNWPDLLIGVALIMVIAMIVITLLSGGSLASLVRRDTPQPLTTDAGTDAAAPADSSAAAGTSSRGGAADTETADTTGSANGATGAAGASGDYDVFVPEVPGQDAATADGTGTEGDGETNVAGSSSDTASSATGTGDDRAGATTEGSDGPLPTASQRGRFRVAAGATGSRDGARTSAETLRDDGYDVTVEQKNDLYLLWVGPYASDAGAERVAARLRTDGLVPDAIVYGYGGDSADGDSADTEADTGTTAEGSAEDAAATPNGGGAANGNNSSALASNAGTGNASVGNAGTDASPASTTGNTTRTPPVSAAGAATEGDPVAEDLAAGADAGQLYLQVGAFISDESAAPRLAQLEQLGLSVTSSETDNGLLRLFVGPYGEAQMAQLQTRLTAQGIESFPVSQ